MRINRSTITFSAVLMVSASLAVAGHAPPASAAPVQRIANDTIWHDTAGAEIKAQGGNVLKIGSTYYWVGAELEPSPDPEKAVNLYSSNDLENWTHVAAVLDQATTPGLPTGWLGRPQLNYNSNTGKFVIHVEVNGPSSNLGNALGIATADEIGGPYTYHGSALVNGLTMGDHSVFVEGSNAYLVYVGDSATRRNVSMNIAPLSDDWLSVQPPIFSEGNSLYEAPGITKVGSTYYLFASGKNWWNATPTSYRTSSDLVHWNTDGNAGWKWVRSEPSTPATALSFGTQFEQLIAVTGSEGTVYLHNGDRYSQFYAQDTAKAPGGLGRNAWYPVTFGQDGVPMLHGATDVDVDAAAGTLRWNEVANGRFGLGVANTGIPMWTATGTAGAARVEDDGPADRHLVVSGTGQHSSWVAQDVTLANGTYTLAFDYRSSGGHGSAFFSVKEHGGNEQRINLSAASAGWSTKTMTFTVTDGRARIGFWAEGSGGKWMNVDEVSIWRQ